MPGQTMERRASPVVGPWLVITAVRPLQALIAAPSILFLAMLTAMLFRPPDVQFYNFWIELHFSSCCLWCCCGHWCCIGTRRLSTRRCGRLAGLLLLGLAALLVQPYDAENWSVLAAKWVVPLALYHVAGSVFDTPAAVRRFETFALVVLGYLCLIAIFFLLGAKGLIFPRYILDEGLGIHADRARGPFLQAVANGVTLNMLGLIAMDRSGRKRLRGISALLLMLALPLAILATQTRAVWLSFAGSILMLSVVSSSARVRRACICLILAGGLGLLAALSFMDGKRSIYDRLEERSPVSFGW